MYRTSCMSTVDHWWSRIAWTSINVHDFQDFISLRQFGFLIFLKELNDKEKANKYLGKPHEWPLLSSTVQLKYTLHEDTALLSKTNGLLVSKVPAIWHTLSAGTSRLPSTKGRWKKLRDEIDMLKKMMGKTISQQPKSCPRPAKGKWY